MNTLYFFFFFQAEDGIRDYKVTGVQTCALPISLVASDIGVCTVGRERRDVRVDERAGAEPRGLEVRRVAARSEERRVGKEGRFEWRPVQKTRKREHEVTRACEREQSTE